MPSPVVQAKTEMQKEYIRCMIENDITICEGLPGTGKSFLAVGIGLQKVYSGEVKKLVVTKPLVPCGDGLGWLPGDAQNKTQPYFMSLEYNIRQLLSKEKYKKLIDEKRIIFQPMELMRGMTYEDSWVVVDEVQNADRSQIKMVITRMGVDSKLIFTGDVHQSDIGHENGLSFLLEKLSNTDLAGIVRMGSGDIQRNPKIARLLAALEK